MNLLKAISDGNCPQICEWEEEINCKRFNKTGIRTITFIGIYCKDCDYNCEEKK